MTGSTPLDVILDLLRSDQGQEQNPARDRARNVQAGLAMIAHKLDDLTVLVDRWGSHAVRMLPGPGLSTLFHAQDIGNTIGVAIPGPTPEDFAQFLRTGIQAMRDSLSDVTQKLQPYLDHPGNPDRIVRVAEGWNAKVGGPVSGLVSWFDPETLQVDNKWSGSAAEAYRAFFPSQREAAGAISERAEGIGSALRGIAGKVDDFWTDVDDAINGAARDIAGMSISLLSPDFLSSGSDILQKLNERVDSLLEVLQTARAAYRDAVTVLVSTMNDNTPFPSGQWPRPSTLGGISDKPADWIPRPPESNR